jgi:hypothetical protein
MKPVKGNKDQITLKAKDKNVPEQPCPSKTNR